MAHADHATHKAGAAPGVCLLLQLKQTILRNRLRQLVNQSPLRLLLILLFVAGIWQALYALFDGAFVFMRRFEESAIAIPYVFHIFFVAMTLLLAFSSAVLAYGALFSRAEPSFLITAPFAPRAIVTVIYLEALFYSSWSLLLLGVPLMLAIGHAQDLPWYFYAAFAAAFIGFVPIPGALGLLAAVVVALWLPRVAKRTLFHAAAAVIALAVIWWGRLWALSATDSDHWLRGFMAEFEYFKAALLPSTWVTRTIQATTENNPRDAAFYLAVTWVTALFFSWIAVNIAGAKLLTAFGRAHSAPHRPRAGSGWASRWLTRVAFVYLPPRMRLLILKDVRTFLRDPLQWSQLVILFGLLALYLAYLPRSRPEGFSLPWQGLICFLNYGAITLILSTFTSRFVFPMVSLEGRQIWLVGLWPMSRRGVLWAKFAYAMTITAAALTVTALAVRSLDLPRALSVVQIVATLATCAGLCGLAVGLGARLPNYRESNSGRIAAGLGGTVNLIGSVGLVALSIGLFGGICYRMVGQSSLGLIDPLNAALFVLLIFLGAGSALGAMHLGIRSFQKQQF